MRTAPARPPRTLLRGLLHRAVPAGKGGGAGGARASGGGRQPGRRALGQPAAPPQAAPSPEPAVGGRAAAAAGACRPACAPRRGPQLLMAPPGGALPRCKLRTTSRLEPGEALTLERLAAASHARPAAGCMQRHLHHVSGGRGADARRWGARHQHVCQPPASHGSSWTSEAATSCGDMAKGRAWLLVASSGCDTWLWLATGDPSAFWRAHSSQQQHPGVWQPGVSLASAGARRTLPPRRSAGPAPPAPRQPPSLLSQQVALTQRQPRGQMSVPARFQQLQPAVRDKVFSLQVSPASRHSGAARPARCLRLQQGVGAAPPLPPAAHRPPDFSACLLILSQRSAAQPACRLPAPALLQAAAPPPTVLHPPHPALLPRPAPPLSPFCPSTAPPMSWTIG